MILENDRFLKVKRRYSDEVFKEYFNFFIGLMYWKCVLLWVKDVGKSIMFSVYFLAIKVGFQPVQGVRPPHQEAVYNAVFGKPKTDRFSCQNRFPTLLESKKGHHPDKKFYNSEGDCYFSERQLQKKFKHAGDFGIDSNYNSANGKVFEKAIVDHMKTAQQYCGVYHGDAVINYFNETTKLNVMIKKEDKTFISGWSVNKEQVEYIRKGEKYNE